MTVLSKPVTAAATPRRNPIVDLAGRKLLPIGHEDFEEVVSRSVFIDKSLLIRDLLDSNCLVTLFCRPRRFGKSLAMRMLQCFFEAPFEPRHKLRRSYFENLAIWDEGDFYRAEQGKYPVVYLSLGSVSGKTWEDARAGLARLMSRECTRHDYLLQSAKLGQAEKNGLERLADRSTAGAELDGSLAFLCDCLFRHYDEKTVVLIDEYDRPVTAGHLNGYRDEAIDFMRSWLTDALKATDALRLACLTGVQRVSRESIFSGLNNLQVNTALDAEYTEGFGFTAAEAKELARYLGLERALDEMRSWYDGYCFGGTDVYNPWSALCFLHKGEAQPYWGNTSDNAIVHELFQRAGNGELDELRALTAGGTIAEPLNLSTVFSELDTDPSASWSQLYLAGYVTTDDAGRSADNIMPRRLRVPNREVAWLFRSEFFERAQRLAGSSGRLVALHTALASGDAPGLAAALHDVLKNSLSCFDLTHENAYHTLLVGLVYTMAGYRVPLSNRESGDGRPDLVLLPEQGEESPLPAIVVAVKRLRTATEDASGGDGNNNGGDRPDALEALAQAALEQAQARGYAHGLPGKGALLWGVAFSGKHSACRCAAAPRP